MPVKNPRAIICVILAHTRDINTYQVDKKQKIW